MADIAMCKDDECPSRLKCYRYLAYPEPDWQDYAFTNRGKGQKKCGYYLPATCCETIRREWVSGTFNGETKECMFCNKPSSWNGKRWID